MPYRINDFKEKRKTMIDNAIQAIRSIVSNFIRFLPYISVILIVIAAVILVRENHIEQINISKSSAIGFARKHNLQIAVCEVEDWLDIPTHVQCQFTNEQTIMYNVGSTIPIVTPYIRSRE